MVPTTDIYVPGLRWRQGEYQALLRLSDVAKGRVVPLITLPPIEFDFEDGKPKTTVQDHVADVSEALQRQLWRARPAWIDVDPTLQASKMTMTAKRCLNSSFARFESFGAHAAPIVSLGLQSRYY